MKRTLVFSLALIFLLANCAAVPHSGEVAATGIKGKKEILVAEDASKGRSLDVMWCGSNALLLAGRMTGTVLLDIRTRERVRISDDPEDEIPLQCTPDGKWFVYYRRAFIPNPSYEEYDGPGENPYQMEIPIDEVYRYEVATGKRSKFATTGGMDPRSDWLSPDGKKILLRPWYPSLVEPPVPWLESVWFSNERWDPSEHVWFQDSSGVAAIITYTYGIGVEFFGEDGWARLFEDGEEFGGFSQLRTGKDGKVYLDSGGWFYRCDVSKKGLDCEKVLKHGNLGPYEVLSNGEIVFSEVGNNECIFRISAGEDYAECVIGARYGNKIYDDVSLIGTSPDGRWLAFHRFTWPVKIVDDSLIYESGGHFYYDLFLIDLKDD